ncbi:MAG: tRNA pseudouridine(55) synthase TruB [Bacteroidetes bacterium]|nr:MAG: tRNA pseudouridine(55) synthase TruB [Bacteroidota bacterium]TAE69647.1 MAG: tRNA pseudouridine(55) synthase TruB [Bacteroidota bacterium]TAF98404.1 MAG: tRNA pseudouridine(55) synthase TruB [Bacteroidota bacterium]
MTKVVTPFQQFFLDGQVLCVNKPLEWTSFDVIRKIRNQLKIQKVGHAGTLDPLATGLLIICTGKFTKRINEFMGQPKEYTGTITLGATTPTYDLESEPTAITDATGVTAAQVQTVINSQFLGEILQTPPIHSAIKQAGKPVYILARKGVDVVLEPRPITLYEFELVKLENATIHFRVLCSTGTYIRSLANDVGKALGVGGYLSSLQRTKIGNFSSSEAMSVEDALAFIQAKKSELETSNAAL